MIRRAALTAVAAGLVVGLLPAPAAQALSAGVAFSAVSTAAWQTDGVAYAVTSTQGKVLVGGSFQGLRPPGASTQTTRSQPALAVLDADSGAPATCQFSLALTGGTPLVKALTTSPDGSVVYVGGDFTSINGVTATRVGALDLAGCRVKPLSTVVSGKVNGLAATASTLYLAGEFGSVTGQSRHDFAAVNAVTGGVLPFVADANVAGNAVAVSPGGSMLAIGGAFTSVNGQDSRGLAVVESGTGKVITPSPAGYIQLGSATKTIVSDGQSFYAGNEGTGPGVFDGRLAIDWQTLTQRWRDTCLGATQGLVVDQGTLYVASHAHDCGTMNEFQDGARHMFLAQRTSDARLRGWYPKADNGIGAGIGARALNIAQGSSGSRYLYAVGEFTKVNDAPQQGITRFGTADTAALATPSLSVAALRPSGVQVRVRTVVDNDDDTLTYKIYRDGKVIWTGSSTSFFWSKPQVTVTDKTVRSGSSYSYQVQVTDGRNTSPLSAAQKVTATSGSTDYAGQVRADGAQLYWRFDATSGTTEWNAGVDSASAPGGQREFFPTLGASGAFGSDKATSFDGTNDYAWTDQLRTAPTAYSLETWVKTTTTKGGLLVGFSDSRPGPLNFAPIPAVNHDRLVYMNDAGRLVFGSGAARTVLTTSTAYNDGRWHHVIATQGGGTGMRLYVDGAIVGQGASDAAQTPYRGVWKVGGDSLSSWPGRPTSDYLAATIDETAVYEGKVLSAAAVAKHYQLAGGAITFNAAPSSAYGKAVYTASPLLYWPLDGRSRSVADRTVYGRYPAVARTSVKTHVKGSVGRAVTLKDKSSSTVGAKRRTKAPKQWSAEVIFKTKSSRSGALVSFQNRASGTSSSINDVVYLTKKGAVVAGTGGQTRVTVSSRKGLADKHWHHVLATFDGSVLRLYVDGTAVGKAEVEQTATGRGYWRLGGRAEGWPAASTKSYGGSLDELALYGRALTQAEATAHARQA